MRVARRIGAAFTLWAGAACAAAGAGLPAQRAPAVAFYEISVNGQAAGQWPVLDVGGRLYARADAMAQWRLKPRANAVATDYLGQPWYALAAVPGYESHVDTTRMALALTFSADQFVASRLAQQAAESRRADRSVPAVFLNYDLAASRDKPKGVAANVELGALAEIGFTSDLGVLTTNHIARRVRNSFDGTTTSFVRAETTFTRNYPNSNLTARIGDTSARESLLGRSFYFGGIQLARNYELNPSFVTQPVPTLQGAAAMPSTVELYVNDVLRQTSRVQPGPFVLDQPTLLSENGRARIVVRDVLGRETVIEQALMPSSNLLAPGLSDWSIEAGAPRRNLGTDNASYGAFFMAGTHRLGLTPTFTSELRAELSRASQNAGVGATLGLPFGITGEAALGISHAGTGLGKRWMASLEQSGEHTQLNFMARASHRNFAAVDIPAGAAPSKLELSATGTRSMGRLGNLGIGLAYLAFYDRPAVQTLSVNYSIQLPGGGAMSVAASRAMGAQAGTSASVSFVMPLDLQVNLTAGATKRGDAISSYVAASRNFTAQEGWAWRAQAGTQEGQPYAEGGGGYQWHAGVLSADISESQVRQAVRLGATGGLVFAQGRLAATRRLDGSFAVVEVPGQPGLRVGLNGAAQARTDSAGVAFLTGLAPYQPNHVVLNPADLPFGVELDNLERLVVPAQRSGVLLSYTVRGGRSALLHIEFDDGQPAPPGAIVRVDNDSRDYYVARRGAVFVGGLGHRNSLKLTWKDQQCALHLVIPEDSTEEIVRPASMRCTGVSR